MIKLFKASCIVLLLLITGCKSKVEAVSSGNLSNKISTNQIIKSHLNVETSFKTLQSKLKIDYKDGDKSQGIPASLRIEKDKAIWINGPLGLARALVTPKKVQFYNKLTSEYFDGDFSLISTLLGTDLDFTKLQNLLLGEAIYNLNDDKYVSSITNDAYILKPKKQRDLFELLMLFDPDHFKVKAMQVAQPSEKRLLEVDYKSYQKIEKQYFPKDIKIDATEDDEKVTIQIELKSITLNETLRFPFKIPSGFEEIIIK